MFSALEGVWNYLVALNFISVYTEFLDAMSVTVPVAELQGWSLVLKLPWMLSPLWSHVTPYPSDVTCGIMFVTRALSQTGAIASAIAEILGIVPSNKWSGPWKVK